MRYWDPCISQCHSTALTISNFCRTRSFFCIILYFTVVLYVSTCCDALYLITPIETVTDGIVNEQVCPQPRSYYSSQERFESRTSPNGNDILIPCISPTFCCVSREICTILTSRGPWTNADLVFISFKCAAMNGSARATAGHLSPFPRKRTWWRRIRKRPIASVGGLF